MRVTQLQNLKHIRNHKKDKSAESLRQGKANLAQADADLLEKQNQREAYAVMLAEEENGCYDSLLGKTMTAATLARRHGGMASMRAFLCVFDAAVQAAASSHEAVTAQVQHLRTQYRLQRGAFEKVEFLFAKEHGSQKAERELKEETDYEESRVFSKRGGD